jgi:hypothetical protein
MLPTILCNPFAGSTALAGHLAPIAQTTTDSSHPKATPQSPLYDFILDCDLYSNGGGNCPFRRSPAPHARPGQNYDDAYLGFLLDIRTGLGALTPKRSEHAKPLSSQTKSNVDWRFTCNLYDDGSASCGNAGGPSAQGNFLVRIDFSQLAFHDSDAHSEVRMDAAAAGVAPAAGVTPAAPEQALPGRQQTLRHLVQGPNGFADNLARSNTRRPVSEVVNTYGWGFFCAAHDIQYVSEPSCPELDPGSGSVMLHTRFEVQILPDSVSGESGGLCSPV